MSEIVKEKAGAKTDHEESHGRDAPGVAPKAFSKWKALAGGLALATGLGLAQPACSNDSPTTNIDVPAADGGCTTDGGDAACVDPDGGEAGADAGPQDSGPTDGGPDMDAGHDGGEGGMDAGPQPDGGMDGGPVVDGGSDGGPVTDGGTDSGTPDAGGIVCGSATVGTWSGMIHASGSQNLFNYTFGYVGIDGSGNALMALSCGGQTFEAAYPCPVGVETDISRPADGVAPAGRTIKITPAFANAMNANLFIRVTQP